MAKLAIRGGKAVRNKPFPQWPICSEEDVAEVANVLKSGNWSYHARKHEKQTEFAEKFAHFHDSEYGICTNSGAAALAVSLKAAGVEAGNEVIVPDLTFVATASAALLIGATPVLVDVDPETYCLDVNKAQEAVTDQTRAIIPVHLYCRIADMDGVMRIAEKNDLVVVEDCAHVHGSKWKGKGVGSIGTLGCFSFQQSKIMTAGEGGIIITSRKDLEERCTSFVDCGRVRKDDRYAQSMLGWNSRMTEFQAAILLGQLERLPDQIRKRETNAEYLSERLEKIEGIAPLKKDERVTTQSYYYYVFKYNAASFENVPKDRFIAALYFEGIPAESIYEPVHRSPLFKIEEGKWPLIWDSQSGRTASKVDYSSISCPTAERASYEEAVAIPHSVLLGSREDIDDVVTAIEKMGECANELRKSDSSLRKAVGAARRYVPRALRHPKSVHDIIDELRRS
jgi:dTDP-4-amino-4,6-dideoxygalactose transaminase